MKRIFISLFLFLVSVNIFCQENILYSDNGYIYFRNQNYNIMIALVNDLMETMNIWNVPNVAPIIKQTTTVRINEPISLFIVYATNKDSINLTYNLKLIEPNGEFSENEYNGLIISNNVINKNILYMAVQLPTITFDEEEEIGEYYFIIEAYDNNEFIKTFVLQFSLLEK